MPHPLIDKLNTIPQEQLEVIYQNVFNTQEGQLVLEDLKGRFWEYAPPEGANADQTILRVGQQSVLFHIKNMMNPHPKETVDGVN